MSPRGTLLAFSCRHIPTEAHLDQAGLTVTGYVSLSLSRRNMRFRQAQREAAGAAGRHSAASRCRQPAHRPVLRRPGDGGSLREGGLSPRTTAEPASSVAQCPVLLALSRRRELPDVQTHYKLPRSLSFPPIVKIGSRAGLQTMSRIVCLQHGSFS